MDTMFSYRVFLQTEVRKSPQVGVRSASHPMLPHPRPQRDKAVAVARGGDVVQLQRISPQPPDCILGPDWRPPHALLRIPMPAVLARLMPDSTSDFGCLWRMNKLDRPDAPWPFVWRQLSSTDWAHCRLGPLTCSEWVCWARGDQSEPSLPNCVCNMPHQHHIKITRQLRAVLG